MKNNKKTFRYTQCFKTVEKELTWDLFVHYLKEHIEFFFRYGSQTIDIAFRFEDKRKIYELNISDDNKQRQYLFDTAEDLLFFKAFDGASLHDIWDVLEN